MPKFFLCYPADIITAEKVYVDGKRTAVRVKNLYPIKIIVNEDDLVIIEQKGEINLFHIKDKINSIIPDKNYQCLFILRNCHLISSCIINEIDFLLLDPIRLSVNILNLIESF